MWVKLTCSVHYCAQNYVYILSRTDSNFKVPPMTVQSFSNVVLNSSEHAEISSVDRDMPTHTSMVTCKDGYRPDAMLFVDENFAQNIAQRETSLSALSFKPVVRFCSSHYRYVVDVEGKKRIVQVGVGVDEHLDGLGFREPLSARVSLRAAAAAPQTVV